MEREKIGWCNEHWASTEEDILFDDSILHQIDCSNFSSFQNYGLSVQDPGPGLVYRSLHKSDFAKGYIELLSQLTKTGDVTQERFDEQFILMKKCSGVHYVMVIEDTALSKVVASGTLLIERKFTHNAALRGRIEDLVVDSNYRRKHLGGLIVETATLLSKFLGCYKTSLDCSPNLKPFYEKFNYQNASLFMARRFYE